MRWPWSRERPSEVVEKVQAPEWGAWILARKETGGYEHIFVERPEPTPPVTSGCVIPRPIPLMADLHDIEPAFHMRYEKVYLRGSEYINLKALRQNVRTFKLQAREVITDPKRVARRHWHRYMVKKRQERIFEDSRLFI